MIHQDFIRLADESYRAFQSKLIPTVASERILGVRIPELRRYACALRREHPQQAEQFLSKLPHATYDEDMLHGILLNEASGFAAAVRKLDAFLPYVDNWAVCDVLSPRVFRSRPSELLLRADAWMRDAHPFTVRFGIGVLMRFYLDEAFDPCMPERVLAVSCDNYYVKMMQAWYMASALAKQWDTAVSVLERADQDLWIWRRSIQKALESYRIPPDRKAYLRELRTARAR